ncbi:glutamyl-tRNA synthetase [Parapedobacter composti]|uniref:Glutamyl-tRNA synthetase n=1 Tax=Parapedobacter composti TaxID=623281 RepID=A0A1I1F9M6_9SPHI|nr:glutamate--tRNA ligase family protein [Parapedobacter composti]SFB95656.1 glutamyl-tRNA synthetase [Parapedobacter composti]
MEYPHSFQCTRIAPTPSGYLHLGNVLSFALTVAIARRTGARIFLRIDDLDRERIKRAYVEDIFETLDYLELPWDEGPKNYREYEESYSQIHRIPAYRKALQRLQDGGSVFACDCSRALLLNHHPQGTYTGTCKDRGLPLERAGCSWRLRTDTVGNMLVKDYLEGSTRVTFPPKMHYFVVRKKDGFPAYQLASLIDDIHFGIDLIIRGADLWESTLAQIYLADVLGCNAFQQVTFYHHALLLKSDGRTKLSKSAGATSIQYLRKQGKTRADIYEMISRMLGLEHTAYHWEDLTVVR